MENNAPVIGIAHPYLEGVICYSDGSIRTPAGNIVFGWKNSGGYLMYSARDGHNYLVHRLICEAFHGPCPAGKEVDHRNRIRDDNRPENLHWVTRSENNFNTAKSEAAFKRLGYHPVDNPRKYSRQYNATHVEQCKLAGRRRAMARKKERQQYRRLIYAGRIAEAEAFLSKCSKFKGDSRIHLRIRQHNLLG